jgi:LacI family transcriptional regulator
MAAKKPKVGLATIAQRTRLSTQTVCHILNPQRRHRYAAATVRRVLRAADDLGYRPNRAARALVTGRTQLVGLWVLQFRSSHYARVLHHLERCVRLAGYDPVVSMLRGNLHAQFDSLGGSGWAVDGVVAVDPNVVWIDPATRRQLAQRAAAFPFVSLGNYCLTEADHVRVDLHGAAQAALRHLISSGRRRIAFVGEKGADRPEEPRFAAYHEILREDGLPTRMILSTTADRPDVLAAVREAFEAPDRPDAIFCHNDDKALAVYRSLRDLGLRIPQDVAVIGCDGIDEGRYIDPTLTTIEQPVERMCELAWRFLQHRMLHPGAARQSATLQAELVVRGSSAEPSHLRTTYLQTEEN